MSAPNYGSAAQQATLMLQKINKKIELVQNLEMTLDKMFTSIGPGDEIGLQNYRLPYQTETGTIVGAYNPDGGAYFQGSGPQYPQGILAPFALLGAASATELSQRISKGGADVVVNNYVNKMIADMKRKVAHKRNAYLQGYNTGQVATIDSTYAGGGATVVQLATPPFGGRLIDVGDQLQDFDSANNLRGTFNVLDVSKNSIGGIDTMTIDAAPAGMVAGDGIFMLGVAATTPLFFNGLTYLVSPTTTGEYLGIDRGSSYVQSPAFNANGAFLTLGGTQAFLARMEQALGSDRFADERRRNFWYGHPAQWLSAQTLGFAKQINMLKDGKAPMFDGVPSPFGMKTIAGLEFKGDTMAATDKLYWLDTSVLCRIRYPGSEAFIPGPVQGMFWPRVVNGLYTSQSDIYYQDSVNYASRNNWANGVMYSLGVQPVLQA